MGKFNIFANDFDASETTFLGVPVSLRLVARPCLSQPISEDHIVHHQADKHTPALIPKYNATSGEYYAVREGGEVEVLGRVRD